MNYTISEEPRALSLQEMEETNGGGCNKRTEVFAAAVGLAAGAVALLGPVGVALATPTALGLGVVSLICAIQD